MFTIFSDEIPVYEYPYFEEQAQGPYFWSEVYVPDMNNCPQEIIYLHNNYKSMVSYQKIGLQRFLLPVNIYYDLYYSDNNDYGLFANYIMCLHQDYLNAIPCVGINMGTSNEVQVIESPEIIEKSVEDIFNFLNIDLKQDDLKVQELKNKCISCIIQEDERELIRVLQEYLSIEVDIVCQRFEMEINPMYELINKFGTLDSLKFYPEYIERVNQNKTQKFKRMLEFIRDHNPFVKKLLNIKPEALEEYLVWHRQTTNKLPYSNLIEEETKLKKVFDRLINEEITKEQAREILDI